jgi:hypothetical protein
MKKIFSAKKWAEANQDMKKAVPFIFDLCEKTWVQDCDGMEIKNGKMVGKTGCEYSVVYQDAIIEVEDEPKPAPAEKNPPRYRIVIECDGGDVTRAEMVVNGKVVRKSGAKRNPEDRFDFKTGAEYAFNRLFEKEEKNGFKVGDRVVCVTSVGLNRNVAGAHGTVRTIEERDGCAGIEFDKNVKGHDLHGEVSNVKPGHCWFCRFEHLKHEEKPFAAGDRVIVEGIKDECGKHVNGKRGTIICVLKNVPSGREGGIDGHEFVDVADVRFDDVKIGTNRIYIERLKHE